MKTYVKIVATVFVSLSAIHASSPPEGSKVPAEVVFATQYDLGERYPGCGMSGIKILALVDLKPAELRSKRNLKPGDQWTEKWKIDACGKVAVHAIDFELIETGGRTGYKQKVHAAENTANSEAPVHRINFPADWTLANRQKKPAVIVREYVTGGEKVTAWTRLLTFMNYGGPLPVETALTTMRNKFRTDECKADQLRVLSQTTTAIIFFRDYRQCKQPTNEINLVRMENSGNKLVTIVYAMRTLPGADEIEALAKELSELPLDESSK